MPSQAELMSPISQKPTNSQDTTYRSPQMRKEVLRNKFLNAQALQSNVNTGTLKNLEKLVDEVDTINQEGSLEEKIRDQGEILLDSEIMSVSSNVLKRCTFSLSNNMNTYDYMEFANNTKSYLRRIPDTVPDESDILDWNLLGKEVIKYFKRTPKLAMILGTLKPIPKREIVRRKVVREAQAPTKRPENVVTLDKVEDSVEKIIHEIQKIIRNYQKQYKKPLDFFALVLHPTDFGKTIENILHVSFLIRDGHIKLNIDENGIPHIEKSSKDELAEAVKTKNTKNIQNVISLSINHWKSLIEVYKIDKPMIEINIRKE